MCSPIEQNWFSKPNFFKLLFFLKAYKRITFSTLKRTCVHLVLLCVSKATEIIRSCDNTSFIPLTTLCGLLLCYCRQSLTHISFRTLMPDYISHTISCKHEICFYCHVMTIYDKVLNILSLPVYPFQNGC